ncbi:hypothetical protein GCM10010435_21370 [Winogradskya consettensis]|uniref:DUF4365 domain-containing protein n=1 Tax=Winogradskya consettensis TaxID=113560 RepID=A0A919VKK3_9ACTN|nr:DUF4365 domain-containing protein [Actinoplanes consettensis]GIM66762.1 hypothetical protein Aco04nite_03340 [Actinoplanes consettensis]
MNANVHQGLHGEGFIFALASAAGLTTSRMNLDVDGVDWQIAASGPRGTVRSPKIECQVKSKSAPDLRDEHYRVRLPIESYNKIAGEGFQIPRFLFVVVVPVEASDYAACRHEGMTLGNAGYWLAMAQFAPQSVEEHGKSIVLDVPKANLLTPVTLRALLIGDLEGAVA